MPPLVPDSDDEDAEDLSAQPTDEHERWVPSVHSTDRAALAPVTTAASNDDPSTRSTERLQRQIRATEASLFDNLSTIESMDGATERDTMTSAAASSGSPTTKCTKKRRNTDELTSGIVAGQLPSIKRAKTAKTHSFEHLTGDEGRLDQMQDGSAFKYSPAHVSDHSNASLDFANHEPVVLFRDSGSTVPDNESQQERIMEELLRKKQMALTAGGPIQVSDEAGENMKSSPYPSPFPYSASTLTQSTRIGKTQEEKSALTRTVDGGEVNDADLFAPKSSQIGPSQTLLDIDSLAQSVLQHSTQDLLGEVPNPEKQKRQSSPIVQIPVKVAEAPSKEPSTNNTTSRKRKVHDEPITTLSSDEAAIGLPKEQYKPRPSKRRAASMVEEPVDLSMIPGKKKRVKRTKTGPAAVAACVADADGMTALQLEEKPNAKEQSKRKSMEPEQIENTEQQESEIIKLNPKNEEDGHENLSQKANVPAKDNEDTFVVPQAKQKSFSKMKRSQTTIFEDHVEFSGSQRALNLSQQQEKRKSALQDVKNESRPAGKKRRVIEDDDDDEDELAGEDTIQKKETADSPKKTVKEPTKKNDKGRPKKAVPESKMKSKEFVHDDSEDDVVEKEPEPEEVPSKNKRGRPAKSKAATPPEPEKEDEPEEPPAIDPRPETPTTLSPTKPATQEPTPSPEKATPTAEKHTVTKADKKSASATHSPIKSGLLVPYRVGLSKRHRIPSLLRTMKPPVKR